MLLKIDEDTVQHSGKLAFCILPFQIEAAGMT